MFDMGEMSKMLEGMQENADNQQQSAMGMLGSLKNMGNPFAGSK